jgi:hypothetical protein
MARVCLVVVVVVERRRRFGVEIRRQPTELPRRFATKRKISFDVYTKRREMIYIRRGGESEEVETKVPADEGG